MAKKNNQQFITSEIDLFDNIKEEFLNLDPGLFSKNKIRVDQKPLNVVDGGWKFMDDVYKYIALQATKPDGKPTVMCKGRQVGGSVMGAALDIYFTNSGTFVNPPIKVAHLFPQSAQVKKFSQDKLEGIIKDAKDDFINKNKLKTANAVDNMTFKQFQTGSLFIESTGKDGDRIRGMTLDVIMFDEVQDMIEASITNTTKTLTQAKYGPVGKGVQVYYGTPKERGSYFNKIWEASDQRFYHLGCTTCKQTYPFYQTGSEDWRNIWITGFDMKCPHCGAITKKVDAIEHGKWVPSKSTAESKFVGFHLNQLYIPNYSLEVIKDLMPEYNPVQTERAWQNEVLGEFYSGVGLPLTKTEILDKCIDYDRAFSSVIRPNEKVTYLGMDWGEKVDGDNIDRGQSFSCMVVLSAQSDGTLLVEHAHKLRQNTPSYKKETISEMFRRFSIQRAISDFFYGQDIVREMQVYYKDRLLAAQGSGNMIKPLIYKEDELIVAYNKDLIIDELFTLFRNGKIRFPWKSYEYVEWLIDHSVSMETGVKIVNGQSVKTYKKGHIQNDGLMALMYAYMAYKFDLTKGYKIVPGAEKKDGFVRPILAHVSRSI